MIEFVFDCLMPSMLWFVVAVSILVLVIDTAVNMWLYRQRTRADQEAGRPAFERRIRANMLREGYTAAEIVDTLRRDGDGYARMMTHQVWLGWCMAQRCGGEFERADQ